MKNLDEALAEITAIRSQIARTAEFRGYGPVTVAATGALAIGAAAVQTRMFPGAARDVTAYLFIWISAAMVAVLMVGLETVVRSRHIHSGLAQEMLIDAIEQLVPSALSGILLTAVLVRVAPETTWMLPGLWQILLSLGAFASVRFLPRGIVFVAAWYLVAGLLCLWWSSVHRVLAPWAMGVPFGIGQLLAAAILQWSQTSDDGSS